ncbi:hypothetical protein [Methylorubrum zatmanii]
MLVTVDETKFTPEFMEEFRKSFFPFHTIDEHIGHIGQLAARGMLRDDFIEGYGPPAAFGIKVSDPDDLFDFEVVESPNVR